jgi:hypothetical protein
MSKNNRLKEWKKLVKEKKIDIFTWNLHFPNRRPDKVTCKDCLDYDLSICNSGQDPIKCFIGNKVKVELG